jgi:hypothetical protein
VEAEVQTDDVTDRQNDNPVDIQFVNKSIFFKNHFGLKNIISAMKTISNFLQILQLFDIGKCNVEIKVNNYMYA